MFKTTKYNIHHDTANREVLTESPVLVNQQIFMSKVTRWQSEVTTSMKLRLQSQQGKWKSGSNCYRLPLLSPVRYRSFVYSKLDKRKEEKENHRYVSEHFNL